MSQKREVRKHTAEEIVVRKIHTGTYDILITRIAVTGGWLYLHRENGGASLAFVPDADIVVKE